MKTLHSMLAMLMACLLVFTACENDDDKDPFVAGDKEGILLVTFGSSFKAPHQTFKLIDADVKEEFPGTEVRWAYTADLILNRLRKGYPEVDWLDAPLDLDNPLEAMKKMAEAGYGKIKVQSLHIIPGDEYDDLVADTKTIMADYTGVKIAVGVPLLNSDADLTKVTTALTSIFATQIEADEPVCLMGHGTPHHPNNEKYNNLEDKLKATYSKFYIGTVDPSDHYPAPMIGDIVKDLAKLQTTPTNVIITPLMSIAGDHANNDMNANTGETDVKEQSWRERLEGENYTVKGVMKGLGDYESIRAIWIEHLKAVSIK